MGSSAKRASAALVLGTALALAFVARAAGDDESWPRQFTSPKGNAIVIYQPQAENLKGNTLVGRAAVSVTKKDEKVPKFGVVFFTARVSVDRDERTVEVLDIKVNRVRFPDITEEKEKKFAAVLEEEIPKWRLVLSYDRALENIKAAEVEKKSAEGLKNEPPKILFATEPTVLVTFDGEAELRDVEGAPLKVAVNTPFLMVLDTRTKAYYLSGGKKWWYRSADPMGPWQPVGGPPPEIAAMKAKVDEQAAQEGAKDASAASDEDGTDEAKPPKILVVTEPAELIVSEGKPDFKTVAGADVLYMANTESDVLMDLGSQEYYVLVSGRWFRSKDLKGGAWAYVSPEALPKTFAKIASTSDIGDVRASVPGTDEAENAVLDAQIPQTTAVKRSEAKLDVQWDGEPKFADVPGTKTDYALNASASVLRIGGRYYACDNAVWYVADAPGGPWLLADSIPTDEVERLPPSVPVYNVKYVSIYQSTPDEVYFGYTPGYVGCYPWYGTVVWGTGWHYRPWVGPVYYWPRPRTWGFNAHYNAWTGWGFGVSWSFPFFNVWHGWGGAFRPVGWYRGPGWGSGWHRPWWGPGGYRPPVHIVNNVRINNYNRPGWTGRPGTLGMPGGRPYAGARPTVGFNPKKLGVKPEMLRSNVYNRLPAKTRDVPKKMDKSITRSLPGRQNNVYADKSGQIYRRTQQGQWQQRSKDQWKPAPTVRPVDHPSRPAPKPELDRDYRARVQGSQKVQQMGGGNKTKGNVSRPSPQGKSAPQKQQKKEHR